MPDKLTSLSMRYVGKRFDDASIPVEVLGDLPALRDIIAALAKEEFKNKNPDRRRVPPGFDRSISFSLSGIEAGSAIAILKSNPTSSQELLDFFEEDETIIKHAYTCLRDIIQRAGRGENYSNLSEDVNRSFARFGRNLNDDERIELSDKFNDSLEPVIFNAEIRKKILTSSKETYTAERQGSGKLVVLDTIKNSIKLETQDFGIIEIPLQSSSVQVEHFDGLLATKAEIEFSMRVLLDTSDVIKNIEEVYSIQPILPNFSHITQCLSRLRSLSNLNKGWLDGEYGERVVASAFDKAKSLIFQRSDLAELFRIYPTEDGGISIEFNKEIWLIAIELTPNGDIELDATSIEGEVYELQEFTDLSNDFYEALDGIIEKAARDEQA